METTHFALKGALEYTVVGARGAKLYRFKKGAPLAVAIPEDVRKFRGQPDLFFECDAEGTPLDPAAMAGGSPPAPRTFRSFRSEPERPAPAPAPPAPSPPVAPLALSEGAGRSAPLATAEPEPSGPEESVPADPAESDAGRGRRARRSRGGP